MKINVNVRTTGSVSSATLIGVNPQGSVGTITAGPTESTESFGKVVWFTVNFDTGFDGWVGADNYTKVSTPTPVPVPTPVPTPTPTPVPTPIPAGAISVSDATELLAAVKTVAAGGTITLSSGNYGAVTISGADKSSKTYLRAASNATPVFTQLDINSDQWDVSGVEVRPTSAVNAVEIAGDNVTFKNNLVTYGNRSGWSASTWLSKVGHGIVFSGTNAVISGNKVINVNYGIQGVETATGGVVSGNTVDGFIGDGMRGLANNMVFSGNTVKNAFSVDDTHQDGFQSWSLGNGSVGAGVVKGITLKGNTFINAETPGQSLQGEMQGIGMFDGMYEDWLIEDNIVIVDHWHGIAVYGAKNVTIRNNTVIDPNNTTPGPAWIQIVNHKNGTAPVNSRIENNISNTINNNPGVTITNNKTIALVDYTANFQNWQGGDVRLKSGSAYIGYGARIGSVTTSTPTPTPTPSPSPSPSPTPTPTPTPTTPNVTTTSNLNVRSTAGGALLGVQPLGSTGISDDTKQVTLKGTTWIYVNFTTGVDGYVSSTYLSGSGASSTNQALINSLLAQLAVLQAALAALLAQ